ncbi:MAG: GTP pyrophosphokinase family protein, partial [Clostridia bacterium]
TYNSETVVEKLDMFRELMMKYSSAIREITTKLQILNDELSLQNQNNPIESIKSRVKRPVSILNKLKRKGIEPSIENIMLNLSDVAGIRVICPFIDDIYKVVAMLAKQDDVTVIAVKDYIKHPKENGYRSYHMIVEIPVFFSDQKQPIRVEIQVRTVAMDFWASLEHQMKYKHADVTDESISTDLKACADVIAATDVHMQELRNRIALITGGEPADEQTAEQLDESLRS